MTNGASIRESDKNLATFIHEITFYCSLRFAEHKSCIDVNCPLAREGCVSCHPHSIMEWLEKEETTKDSANRAQELVKAAAVIKQHCYESQECKSCPFWKDFCLLRDNAPAGWDLSETEDVKDGDF